MLTSVTTELGPNPKSNNNELLFEASGGTTLFVSSRILSRSLKFWLFDRFGWVSGGRSTTGEIKSSTLKPDSRELLFKLDGVELREVFSCDALFFSLGGTFGDEETSVKGLSGLRSDDDCLPKSIML